MLNQCWNAEVGQQQNSISAQHTFFFLILQLFQSLFYHLCPSFPFLEICSDSQLFLECNQLFFSDINASCLSLPFHSIPSFFSFLLLSLFLKWFSYKSQCQEKAVCVDKCWGMNGGVLSSLLPVLLSFCCIHSGKTAKRFLCFYFLKLTTPRYSSPYFTLQLRTC